jgi:hypothetical protein
MEAFDMSPKFTFPKYTLLLSTIAAAGIFAACAGGKAINVGSDDASTTSGVPTGSSTPAAVSFKNDVYPTFSPSCTSAGASCHGGASPAGIVNLGGTTSTAAAAFTSITGTTGVVVAGATATTAPNSLLLCKPFDAANCPGGGVHTGGSPFSSDTTAPYTTILNWIVAGAPNN